jgi:hypothetical protein
MSVLSANVKLVARQGAYSVTISSACAAHPVSFQGNEPFDHRRLYQTFEIAAQEGKATQARPACGMTMIIHPTDPEKTIWGHNPVKIVIEAIDPADKRKTGDCAVLYGYFLYSQAGGLNFYLNEDQSQQKGEFGRPGFPVSIHQSERESPSISVG